MAMALTNEMEYAFGGDPMLADTAGVLPWVEETGEGLALAFVCRHDRTDLVYVIERSTNLVDWESIRTVVPDGSSTIENIYELMDGGDSRFYRIAIER